MLKTALKFSHELLKKKVKSGDWVIDATVGNGFDTVFLADAVGETGHVWGFDLQQQAIEHTQAKLKEQSLNQRVTLIPKGHETLGTIFPMEELLSAAIFNLGYLPKSDKSIITHAETTLKAVSEILPRLKKEGLLILVIYYGHEGGLLEKNEVIHFAETLPQKEYNVLSYQFLNQQNNPPILLAIEKK